MKKIISLLSAIAMMFTLITTVAFADENNAVYFEKTDGKNEVTLKLVLKTNQTITQASVTVDLTDAYAKGAEVTGFTQLSGATVFNVNTAQKVLSTTVNQVAGVTGTLELGTMTLDLSKVTEDFTLTQKRAFSVKNGSTVLTGDFTNDAYGYVVKAPVAETYGTPITEGTYKDKTLYFDTKTMTFVFGTHKGVLIKKGSEEKKFGLKFFEDLGISGEAGSEMTFTAGVIDENGAAKGTYEFSLINE